MKLCEINPFIRFAEKIKIKRKPEKFNVFDSRIFLVLFGVIEIEIEESYYKLKSGDVFYCAKGSCYTIVCSDICELLCLNFDLTQKRNIYSEAYAPVKIKSSSEIVFYNDDVIEDCTYINKFFYMENEYLIKTQITKIIDEFENKRIYFREKSSAILKDILIEMSRRELEKNINSFDAVEKTIAYINDNYGSKIINEQLAKLTGYHQYYLNRIFKKQTGKTIHKYIMEIRINEAKKILMTTKLPICIIAQKTGFCSETHLSNCFENYFGYRPKKYKELFKNNI